MTNFDIIIIQLRMLDGGKYEPVSRNKTISPNLRLVFL